MRELLALLVFAAFAVIADSVPAQVPTCPNCLPMVRGVPATVLYYPQVQYVPYHYQRSVYQPRVYRTPLRDMLFGAGTMQHYYAPMQPQPQGQQ